MKKIIVLLTSLLFTLMTFAQDSAAASADRAATGLRSEGKIYVVVAVLVTILCGLFLYLITLDRKITRLEKNSSSH